MLLTIQALIFLCRARRVQMSEDGEIFINEDTRKIATVCEKGGPRIEIAVGKSSEELAPLLMYLEADGLVKIQGPCYFNLTYSGYHYIQTLISSVLKFLLTSIAVPIIVAFLTTIISLWLTGAFTAGQAP